MLTILMTCVLLLRTPTHPELRLDGKSAFCLGRQIPQFISELTDALVYFVARTDPG